MASQIEISTLLERMDTFTRLHRKLTGMILDYYELTESSLVIFDIIGDDQKTLKDITEASLLDKSTISRQVNALVKKDYIAKEVGKDKRYSYFQLTDHAKEVYQAYKQEAERAFDDLLENWTDDEKQKLSILLMRINRIYQGAI